MVELRSVAYLGELRGQAECVVGVKGLVENDASRIGKNTVELNLISIVPTA